jgi:hypothetical protein
MKPFGILKITIDSAHLICLHGKNIEKKKKSFGF